MICAWRDLFTLTCVYITYDLWGGLLEFNAAIVLASLLQRLWHQLTVELSDFVKHPTFAHGDGLIQLYNNFIIDFDTRINLLSLVRICLAVAAQYPCMCKVHSEFN